MYIDRPPCPPQIRIIHLTAIEHHLSGRQQLRKLRVHINLLIVNGEQFSKIHPLEQFGCQKVTNLLAKSGPREISLDEVADASDTKTEVVGLFLFLEVFEEDFQFGFVEIRFE